MVGRTKFLNWLWQILNIVLKQLTTAPWLPPSAPPIGWSKRPTPRGTLPPFRWCNWMLVILWSFCYVGYFVVLQWFISVGNGLLIFMMMVVEKCCKMLGLRRRISIDPTGLHWCPAFEDGDKTSQSRPRAKCRGPTRDLVEFGRPSLAWPVTGFWGLMSCRAMTKKVWQRAQFGLKLGRLKKRRKYLQKTVLEMGQLWVLNCLFFASKRPCIRRLLAFDRLVRALGKQEQAKKGKNKKKTRKNKNRRGNLQKNGKNLRKHGVFDGLFGPGARKVAFLTSGQGLFPGRSWAF